MIHCFPHMFTHAAEVDNSDSTSMMAGCSEQEQSSVGGATTATYPKVCRDGKQFEAWQKSRPWLVMNEDTGSVQCSTCASVKRLGLHKVHGQRDELAFVDGSVTDCKSAKVLLKKIDKHRDSTTHKKCEEVISVRQSEQIRKGAEAAQDSCCFQHTSVHSLICHFENMSV